MREQGAYKTSTIVLSINETVSGDWESLVDIRKFQQVSRMKFWQKIKFLRDEKILPESCYQVLKLASSTRNNIHVDPAVFAMTEKDLELFRYAHQIAFQIQFAKNSDWFSNDVKEQMRLQADKTAGRVMQEFGSKKTGSKHHSAPIRQGIVQTLCRPSSDARTKRDSPIFRGCHSDSR